MCPSVQARKVPQVAAASREPVMVEETVPIEKNWGRIEWYMVGRWRSSDGQTMVFDGRFSGLIAQ